MSGRITPPLVPPGSPNVRRVTVVIEAEDGQVAAWQAERPYDATASIGEMGQPAPVVRYLTAPRLLAGRPPFRLDLEVECGEAGAVLHVGPEQVVEALARLALDVAEG
ncbi:hypothetical protein ACQP25_44750 (plasmid) [Microtetraspora malaysiensis]|uniref:hypothetical protein n=1 Tax=Microtetraspora malaysiensis TaxID=161358 RepID=UPI003D93AAD3